MYRSQTLIDTDITKTLDFQTKTFHYFPLNSDVRSQTPSDTDIIEN